MDQLIKLQWWYSLHCDGDWEHEYGVEITNIDNPGWHLKIDLTGTALEGFSFVREEIIGANDWYSIQTVEEVFIAAGDFTKLSFFVELFFFEFFTTNIKASEFKFTVYAPLKSDGNNKIWRPLIAKMTALNEFKIIERPDYKIENLRAEEIETLEHINLDQLTDSTDFHVDDTVMCELISFFDFPSLVILGKTGSF